VTAALVDGLVLGSVLAVAALGLTLVFGVLHVLNLAHGEFIAVGAYASYLVLTASGSVVVAAAVAATVAALVGYLVHRVAIRPVLSRADTEHALLAPLITTMAVSLISINAIARFVNSEPVGFPALAWNRAVGIGSVTVTLVDVGILVLSAVAVAGVVWLLRRSAFGRLLRAAADNPDHARLAGVDVRRVFTRTVVLSAALGGLAGLMIAAKYTLMRPSMGLSWLLLALVVVVAGGMGSVGGAFVAALGLGLAHTLTSALASAAWSQLATFAILLAVLLVRPEGLAGVRLERD
jgi:branched-subunit amino acid ABC-type transport system permease component